VFHPTNRSTVNLCGSLSTSLAQFWQSHIPLEGPLRSSRRSSASYLGPPGEAAVMWAATPRLTAFVGSSWGPLVSARHSGFEQRLPTRDASALFTGSEKSSDIFVQYMRAMACK